MDEEINVNNVIKIEQEVFVFDEPLSIDDAANSGTSPEVNPHNNSETSAFDNSVEAVNVTIPVVDVSDNSFAETNCKQNFQSLFISDNCTVTSSNESDFNVIIKTEPDTQIYDFIVIDDDRVLEKNVKVEPSWNCEQNVVQKSVKTEAIMQAELKSEELQLKSEIKLAKNENASECKCLGTMKNEKTATKLTENVKKDIVEGICDPKTPLTSAVIKENLCGNDIKASENVNKHVEEQNEHLQKKTQDLVDDSVANESKSNSETLPVITSDAEGTEITPNKNNNGSKEPSDLPKKIVESNHDTTLILTADEQELENEMSLVVKDKFENFKEDVTPNTAPITDTVPAKTVKSVIKQDELKDDKDKKELKVSNEDEDKVVHDQAEKDKKTVKESKGDVRPKTLALWVTNVTHSMKATVLKKHLSRFGKVTTAKIVTDGKRCFGYVMMENRKDIETCIQNLDGTYFMGKKIYLSTSPPEKSSSKEANEILIANNKAGDDCVNIKSKSSHQAETVVKKECPDNSFKKKLARPAVVLERKTLRDDPLTTKFGKDTSKRFRSKTKPTETVVHRQYLREKEENERLKRKMIEQQKRNHQEMLKQRQFKQQQHEMELKLERERKELQISRELVEEERRKVAKEKLEIQRQKTKLKEDLEKLKRKRKQAIEDFELKRIKRNRSEETVTKYEPLSNENIIKDGRQRLKDERKRLNSPRRGAKKPEPTWFKTSSSVSPMSVKRCDDLKYSERIAPPPPKMSNEFDIPDRKTSERQYDYWTRKTYPLDKKPEQSGLRIEVLDRKNFPERKSELPNRKRDYDYQKTELRKPGAALRKHEYGRDDRQSKRYREGRENYPEKEDKYETKYEAYSSSGVSPNEYSRSQWPIPSYSETWKMGQTLVNPSTGRCEDVNYGPPSYGASSRMVQLYYHPHPGSETDYGRYDQCGQVNVRKY